MIDALLLLAANHVSVGEFVESVQVFFLNGNGRTLLLYFVNFLKFQFLHPTRKIASVVCAMYGK